MTVAQVTGTGAVAQGERAAAAAPGGVAVSGDVHGDLHIHLPPEPIPPAPRPARRRVWIAAAAIIGLIAIGVIWMIARTSAPRPALAAFSHPALQKRDLNDIAAGNGYVWFATEQGLVMHSAATGQTEPVPNLSVPVQAVAVTPEGNVVWFSLKDGRVGRYTAGASEPELFTPVANHQPLSTEVLTILAAPDGTVWFGDKLNGVFRRTPQGTWDAVPSPASPPSLRRVEALALAPALPPTLWMAGGTLVFRWQQGAWDYFDSLNTDKQLPTEVVNDIATDAYQHIWLAHPQGISVLVQGTASRNRSEQVWRNCASSGSGGPIPRGPVLGLAASNQGRIMWVVSEGGLARVDLREEALATDCKNWAWHASWLASSELADFWESNSEIRLAVDELPTGDRATVWLIKLRSNRVLRLDTR